MQNGLYKVSFQVPGDSGDGVVFLRDGQIWGGDSIMYYRGTYAVSGDQFTAQVKTDAHSKTPGMASVFGIDKVDISLTGKHTGTRATVTGTAAQVPNVQFSAVLSKLAD